MDHKLFTTLTLTLILFFDFSVVAQPAGYVEVPHRGLISDRVPFRMENSIFTDRTALNEALKTSNCGVNAIDADPDRETLAYYHTGGDCHMHLAIKVFRINSEKKYKVIIINIYGGCRAGGWRSGWIAFEKMPAGFSADIIEVKVDRIHGPDDSDGFVLPKPPQVIYRETVAATEVDMKGCLPTTGQSQWVLSEGSHLDRALQNDPDADRCRVHIKRLNIDLTSQTLVHYRFHSGHCGRPPNLEFETVKETSSDPAGNRYVLTVSYDGAGDERCDTWTTYPVWLVVPRMAKYYGFIAETKER